MEVDPLGQICVGSVTTCVRPSELHVKILNNLSSKDDFHYKNLH